MNLSNIGAYAKFFVGAASAILTGLQPYYGSAPWYPAVIASVGALLVWLVPNTPAAAPAKATEVK
jgi:hypothetical protein